MQDQDFWLGVCHDQRTSKGFSVWERRVCATTEQLVQLPPAVIVNVLESQPILAKILTSSTEPSP